MRIIIFNVKYSDNLGDGVIAECIEDRLRLSFPNCSIESIDMSGREGFGTAGALSSISSNNLIRSLIKKSYNILPSFIKEQMFVKASDNVITKKLAPQWEDEVKRCDLVIIGGGQIFSDKLLYFPIRLFYFSQLLKKYKKPAAIYGVGVNGTFGNKALSLFKSLTSYNNLFFVSVRDKDSIKSWVNYFSGPEPLFTRDPALLVSEIYKEYIPQNDSRNTARIVGISVMQNKGSANRLTNEELYFDVGMKLVVKGYKVVYFTNGDPSDESVKETIRHRMLNSKSVDVSKFQFLDRFLTPRQLVVAIARFDAVVAHRLHANIIAYSMRIPHVGIGWSVKMASFFESVDRKRYFVEADESLDSEIVFQKVIETMNEGVDKARHHEMIEESRSGLNCLISSIKESI